MSTPPKLCNRKRGTGQLSPVIPLRRGAGQHSNRLVAGEWEVISGGPGLAWLPHPNRSSPHPVGRCPNHQQLYHSSVAESTSFFLSPTLVRQDRSTTGSGSHIKSWAIPRAIAGSHMFPGFNPSSCANCAANFAPANSASSLVIRLSPARLGTCADPVRLLL